MSLQKRFMRSNYLHTYGEYVWTVTCGLRLPSFTLVEAEETPWGIFVR